MYIYILSGGLRENHAKPFGSKVFKFDLFHPKNVWYNESLNFNGKQISPKSCGDHSAPYTNIGRQGARN